MLIEFFFFLLLISQSIPQLFNLKPWALIPLGFLYSLFSIFSFTLQECWPPSCAHISHLNKERFPIFTIFWHWNCQFQCNGCDMSSHWPAVFLASCTSLVSMRQCARLIIWPFMVDLYYRYIAIYSHFGCDSLFGRFSARFQQNALNLKTVPLKKYQYNEEWSRSSVCRDQMVPLYVLWNIQKSNYL